MAATPLFLDELRARPRSGCGDSEFRYTIEDMSRVREKIKENVMSWNEKERGKELADDKKRKEHRAKREAITRSCAGRQALELTLDDLSAPKLRPVARS